MSTSEVGKVSTLGEKASESEKPEPHEGFLVHVLITYIDTKSSGFVTTQSQIKHKTKESTVIFKRVNINIALPNNM